MKPACEVFIEVADDVAELVGAELFALGAVALEVRDNEALQMPNVERPPSGKTWLFAGFDQPTTEGGFDPETLRGELLSAFGETPYRLQRLEVRWRDDTDWATKWKEFFHPIKVGAHFWVAPSWEPPKNITGDDVVITLDPEMAFGTGQHPTTRLCLALIERFVEARAEGLIRAFDVGTGSGILAIGVMLLCQKLNRQCRILGVDNDRDSVTTAQVNAERNAVATIDFRYAELPADRPEGPFDLIVANVLADPLVEMAETIASLLAPQGELVLSGLLSDQADRVVAAYAPWGLAQTVRLDEGEWVALALRHLR